MIIKIQPIFYKQYEITPISDYNESIILLQNILYYHLSEDELFELNDKLIKKVGKIETPYTNLIKIFPSNISYILHYMIEKDKNISVKSFLKEIDIQIELNEIELDLI